MTNNHEKLLNIIVNQNIKITIMKSFTQTNKEEKKRFKVF